MTVILWSFWIGPAQQVKLRSLLSDFQSAPHIDPGISGSFQVIADDSRPWLAEPKVIHLRTTLWLCQPVFRRVDGSWAGDIKYFKE